MRGSAPGASGGQRLARGRPERELSSGRVPDGHHAREIERSVEPSSASTPAATSRNVSGHPPPPPTRRYSRFHAARPCAARSRQSPSISERSYCARQYPPCTTTATGCGPAPEGRKSSHELARVGAVGDASEHEVDAPGRIRTCGLALRRRALYPLSYGRGESGQCIAAVSNRLRPCSIADVSRDVHRTSSRRSSPRRSPPKAWFATAARRSSRACRCRRPRAIYGTS